MSLAYPKHLHSPKDDGSFVVVHDEHEEAEQRKAGWLIAPPSQTRGQEAYAQAERDADQHSLQELKQIEAEALAVIHEAYVDEEADAMPAPKPKKGRKTKGAE